MVAVAPLSAPKYRLSLRLSLIPETYREELPTSSFVRPFSQPTGIHYPDRLVKTRPPFSWVGGKRQLLPVLRDWVPPKIDIYGEPCVGGGALFFNCVFNERRLVEGGLAYLSDRNADLINDYQFLRDDPKALMKELSRPEYANNELAYWKVLLFHLRTPVERAARLHYLQKTSHTGLYRETKEGFDVPFGHRANPKIMDKRRIMALHQALQGVAVFHGGFEDVLKKLPKTCPKGKTVFVYFDPPYIPLPKKSQAGRRVTSFTSYTKDGFTLQDQRKLAQVFRICHERGFHIMASNSNSPLVSKLYAGFNIQTILATRKSSCKPATRGPIPETVIMNYRPEDGFRLVS